MGFEQDYKDFLRLSVGFQKNLQEHKGWFEGSSLMAETVNKSFLCFLSEKNYLLQKDSADKFEMK